MRRFLLNIRRGQGPFYSRLKALAKAAQAARLPLPGFLRPLLRAQYALHFSVLNTFRRLRIFFYTEPLFRGRCERVGRNVRISNLPVVSGPTRIYVGDNVYFGGRLGIYSGALFDDPTLFIGSNTSISHEVRFVVNKEIVVEDGVYISAHCYLADSDGHPRDPQLRVQGRPPSRDEVKPIRICRNAWIGRGCFVHKGVTIGEGAIIGSNSVVLTDIPPFAVALGNPAKVILKDVRLSAQPAAQPVTTDRR